MGGEMLQPDLLAALYGLPPPAPGLVVESLDGPVAVHILLRRQNIRVWPIKYANSGGVNPVFWIRIQIGMGTEVVKREMRWSITGHRGNEVVTREKWWRQEK